MRPVVDFDHHSPEHAADPAATFDRLREQCPVAYTEHYGGFWVVSDWAGVARVAQDPATFSTAVQPSGRVIKIPTGADRGTPNPPIEIDPPHFVAYRRVLDPHCSPKAVARMEPAIQVWADYFLDEVIERGELSLLPEYATPVPSCVTVDWLGLPVERWQFFWEAIWLDSHTIGVDPAAQAKLTEMSAALRVEVEERRTRPRNDLLSALANADIEGERISVDHALGMAQLLLAGGTETTGELLTHALVYLGAHREAHAALLEDDRLLRTATEEFLRIGTPVLQEGRVVTRDVELGGQQLTAGERLLVCWGAGNRDPAVFENPDEVVLDRWPNHHLSFGLGPHRCMGSNIARALFKVMLRTLLRRAPDFRVVEATPARDRGLFNGYELVRLAFTPGERVLSAEFPPSQLTS